MPTQISQKQLKDYLLAKKRHEQAGERLKAKEQEFQTALEAGGTVASGVLTAYVKQWERRNVEWKAVVTRELG